jgi:hypothetical protein
VEPGLSGLTGHTFLLLRFRTRLDSQQFCWAHFDQWFKAGMFDEFKISQCNFEDLKRLVAGEPLPINEKFRAQGQLLLFLFKFLNHYVLKYVSR